MLDGRHGGNIAPDKIRLDFSVNTNPFGMPEQVKEAAVRAAGQGEYYPDISCRRLREEIRNYEAAYFKAAQNLQTQQILIGNGASELIMALAHVYPGSRVLLQTPLFSGYERAFEAAGSKILRMETDTGYALSHQTPEQILDLQPDIAVLCHPGNPVGLMVEDGLMERITDACVRTGTLLIVDECFIPFVQDFGKRSAARFLKSDCDLVIIRAFTKLYAMPGIRLGYAVCSKKETADYAGSHLPEWNVSSIAQAAGLAALKEEDYVRKTTGLIREERERFRLCLESAGFRTVPGEANFIFLHSDCELYDPLLRRGILIRRCDNYSGIPENGWYRIAVRRREENDLLLETLTGILNGQGEASKEKE